MVTRRSLDSHADSMHQRDARRLTAELGQPGAGKQEYGRAGAFGMDTDCIQLTEGFLHRRRDSLLSNLRRDGSAFDVRLKYACTIVDIACFVA